MLKGNLFKRVMPFLLSMAMAFQSVPMTALAVEDPQAAVVSEDTGTTVEPVAETTEGSSDDASDESMKSDEVTPADTGEESSENTGSSEDQAGTEADMEAGESTETAPADAGAEAASETDTGEEAAQPDTQVAVSSTEIVVSGNLRLSGFDSVDGSYTYTTPYSEDDQFGGVMTVVKNAAGIKVNGDNIPNDALGDFKDNYLTLEWREAGNTAAMTGAPKNVGSYVLHLETRAQEGVCSKAEKDVYFNITPKKLTFPELDEVKAGSKVADLKETVAKDCKLEDVDGGTFNALQYTVEVKVYEIKDGAEEETADTLFNKNKDYRVTLEVTFADADAAKNYEVTGGEYLVKFNDKILKTKVETKNPDKEMVETYDKEKTYTASEIAEKYGVTSEVKVQDKDDQTKFTADSDLQAVPKWYTKEINSGIVDFPAKEDVDGITQFIEDEGSRKVLYTLVTAESEEEEAKVGDVGDYYLVFMYEGVDGQYEDSHSNPLKFTIDPIEVILKPTVFAELNTAMTSTDINSALAQVESKLYAPDTTDPTLAGETESDAPVADDKGFYGVSYDDANVTQYYSPEFELVYKSRTKLKEPPAGAAGDDLWTKWTNLRRVTKTADIKINTDDEEYKYFVKFTGNKAVYNANGVKQDATVRPITEATDAANRNYKVKTDSDTLTNEKNMLEVTPVKAAETEIDVTKIIEEFNKEGARGKGGAGKIDDAAWTIYDPDLKLFADKEAYKKAIVTGTDPEIKDTDKDLTYTWQTSNSVEEYYQITRMEKETGETDEDFAKRKKERIETFEASFSGTSTTIPQNAGLYRLHVAYKDSSLVPKNAPADGYAYFLIKKQELMLVADTQYAKYGDDVDEFSRKGYRMYLLPDNTEGDLKDENLLNWSENGIVWQAMNLKKNADGSNTTEWEESEGTFVNNEAHPYVYKAAVWLNDSDYYDYDEIVDVDGNNVRNKAGNKLYWSNYTTKNMAAYDKDADDYKQHFIVGDGYGDFMFDASKIKVVVDRTKLFDDKIYDGKAIADELPEGFVTLTDENGTAIPETKLQINGEPQDGVGTVNVMWQWTDADYKPIPTGEVRYGGTYKLVANFEGYIYEDGTAYSPLEKPWNILEDKDGTYEFTIKPLDVVITPILTKETTEEAEVTVATAGEKVETMLEDWHVDAKPVDESRKIPDGKDKDGNDDGSVDDTWLFNQASGNRWNVMTDEESGYDGYPILAGNSKFTATYYQDNKSVSSNTRIRYGKNYDVKLNAGALFAQYAKSYTFTYKPAALEKINRGDAEVRPTGFFDGNAVENTGEVSIYWEKDAEDGTYKIVPREGIPFVYKEDSLWNNTDMITGKKIPQDKNYIAVKIASPREFDNEFTYDYNFAEKNFVYGNSIKSAGGYVIEKYGNEDWDEEVKRYFITALFPVELDESGKIKEIPAFNVTWEKGYTDTFKFDLTNAKVEANLKRAVAPKSLAFNAVKAKMAVGEEQQLDVKITKAQLSDVVRINYRLAGGVTSNEYASINPETGLITALATNNKKPVAVNVEAYPVRLAEDGKTFEEITGKGVKIAKTKVTITEVTAPVIKKVLPQDTSAEIQFTKVDDGYRGEIYVVKLENKKDANKWKPANFEDAIKEMKNGQWKGTFAIQPQYLTGNRGYNDTLKLCRKLIYPLEKGAYVVYVRNVSAVRTLADGSKVTESAAGTVKMFETTKSLVKELRPYFEVTDEKSKTNPVRYTDEKQKYIVNKSDRGYTVELVDKSAQLLVDGRFNEKALNDAADNDSVWYQLSLKVAEKALGIKLTDTYQDPKLNYYVTDCVAPKFDEKGKITNPSKYVTINNKGKLTFKGVDQNGDLMVRIYVADSSTLFRDYGANTDAYDYSIKSYCNLTITARPDTLTTKKVKTMKVGDAIRLRDYLEYKSGKTKVPNFWSTDIEITNWEEVENAGFWIYRFGDDPEYGDDDIRRRLDNTVKLQKGEYVIVAKKAGAKCDLKLKDWLWTTAGSDEKTQTDEKTINLTTTKIDPVKGLKAVYTDDKAITLNFAHAGHPEAFDIEVKDARGSVVYKRLAYRDDAETISDIYYTKEWYGPAWIKNALTNLQRANLTQVSYVNAPDVTYDLRGNFAYFEKTKAYAYTISTEKLMRLSSYTVSVTPVYEGESAAKPATTKAKTTNIPASYENGDIVNPDNNFQGIGLDINNTFRAYLTSGNTYTVVADGGLAQVRGTDTLTWKSSNAKVASIKANQGSFSATVKALSQGKTTITVTSKVTKKTIARYHIAVKAVGKANHYGGDYETGGNGFYDDFIKTVDPYYEGRLEVLTVSNSVTVNSEDYLNDYPSNDRTWVKFTAPSYGEYTFSCDSRFRIYYNNESEGRTFDNYNATLRLEEGQDIYFKVSASSFTLSVSSYTDFTKLTTAFTEEKPLTVGKGGAWVSFTATEDNYYTFNGDIQRIEDSKSQTIGYREFGMKAGETVFIKVSANGSLWVTKREFTNKEPLAAGGKATMSFTKDNKDDTQYVKFTAGPTGEYTFTYKPSDKVSAEFLALDGNTKYYDGGAVLAKIAVNADDTPEEPEERTVTLFMDAGESIVIAVSVEDVDNFADDAKIDVEISVKASDIKDLAAEQTVTKATTQFFAYTIPNDKAATKYTLTATENATVTWYYSYASDNGNSLEQLYIDDSFTVADGKVLEDYSLKAGDKIYIKVEADKEKDSKVTLTSVTDSKAFDTAAPAGVTLGADGDAEWYTFAVKKAGYYQFTKKVTVAPEGSAAQSAEVKLVDKAFSKSAKYVEGTTIDLTYGESSLIKLPAGDYVFMIKATSDAAEGVKTTVALSVKEIVPTALATGDNTVTVAKGETQYYTFKRATADKYTIKWVPGTDVGNPTVEYVAGDLDSYGYDNLTSIDVTNNDTYTIKVKADSEKALSGKLQVAAETKNFLTSGKTEEFTLTADEGSKTYKFTLPENSALGYVVTVENTSTVPEGQTAPTITVSGDVTVNSLGKDKVTREMTSWKSAFTTKTITITSNDVRAAAEGVAAINATGKITIKPVTAQTLPTTAFKVNKGDENRWYIYTVPADGRYELGYAVGAEQEKSSVAVTWYKKNKNGSQGSQVSTEAYLTKDQQLYAKVEAREIADAGIDVTLKAEKLTTTALTLTNGKAEVDVTADDVKNGAKYYTFKAPAYAGYSVTDDAGTPEVKMYRPNEDGYDNWFSGGTLEKDEEILIKVTAAGKLTVTQDAITELTLDKASAEITIKANESAAFVINIYKNTYYDFAVDSSATNLVFNKYGVYRSGKHLVDQLEGDRYEFTIRNDGTADATLKVTATELTPVTLKLGENSIPVAKDKVNVVEFEVPESYWYTVACSEKSDLKGDLNAGDYFYFERDYSSVLVYTGEEASATAKVTIDKVKPADASGEKITVGSLEAGASKWYAYKTGKAGFYTFETTADVHIYYYRSLDDNSIEDKASNIKAGADTVLYIRAVNDSAAKIENAEITMTCDEATELTVGDNPLSKNGSTYMTFTAPENGEYSFSSSDGYIYYYGESVWQYQEYGNSAHMILKGSVVYLQMYADSENATVTVTKEKEVTLLDHVNVASGEYQWIIFTAPKAGSYTFFSTNMTEGDPKAWFFKNQAVGDDADRTTLDNESQYNDGYGYDDDGGGNRNFKKELTNLSANETIYIAVGHYSLGSPTECDVYVSY